MKQEDLPDGDADVMAGKGGLPSSRGVNPGVGSLQGIAIEADLTKTQLMEMRGIETRRKGSCGKLVCVLRPL